MDGKLDWTRWNSKGESTVAAILPSRMEASYIGGCVGLLPYGRHFHTGYGTGYGIFIVIQWSIRSYFIESQWICRIPYENREDACSRTAYFIRHTALCSMYGIVAYVRHNNHAGSPVLGIPALPHWHESSQLQIKLSTQGTSILTHFFDSKHMDVKNWSATLMSVLTKARTCLPTCLNEPLHWLFILKWPSCTERNMVTGEFKVGAQWKI